MAKKGKLDKARREKVEQLLLTWPYGAWDFGNDGMSVADWVYKDDDLTLETVEKAIGTIPTLKDERIAESQYKIEEAIHAFDEAVNRSVAEAKDRGMFVNVPEKVMAEAGF